MSDTYLILHKVRGEPAFDIAERVTIADEDAWIISTSGWRAYPLRWWLVEDLADISDYPHQYPQRVADAADLSTIPDHFEVGKDTSVKIDIDAFIATITKQEPIRRRI